MDQASIPASDPSSDSPHRVTVASSSTPSPSTGDRDRDARNEAKVPYEQTLPKVETQSQEWFHTKRFSHTQSNPLDSQSSSSAQKYVSSGPPPPSSLRVPSDPMNEAQVSKLDQFHENPQIWDHRTTYEQYIKSHAKESEAQKEISHLRRKIERLRKIESELQEKLSNQDLKVRRAQESAFALMSSNVPRAEDDDIVSSKLKGIRGQWKIFAKDWALKGLHEVEGESAATIFQLVKSLLTPDEMKARDGIMAAVNKAKAPAILLNTVLARFMEEHIVQKPFISAFGLESETTCGKDCPSSIMETLGMLYNLYKEVDVAAAHIWRSDTVRLLNLQAQNLSPGDHQALDRRENYYRKLMELFISSSASKLFRPCGKEDEEVRASQLLEVFRSTGELICRLWSQKAYITILGAKDLVHEAFATNSDLFEAHATHKIESEDTSKDGMPIQLVVEPGIIAWGNERGQCYDTRKVWLRAVVWISSGRA